MRDRIEGRNEGADRRAGRPAASPAATGRARRSAPVAACAGWASRSASARGCCRAAPSAAPCGRRRNAAPRRSTSRPRFLNSIDLLSSACVPTTMSIWPLARPSLVALRSADDDQPARLRDSHRQAGEALLEGLEMLPRQQRRRHHDRHLLARHGDSERRAQRHLGLAEADIAADQPVHDLARGDVVEHR